MKFRVMSKEAIENFAPHITNKTIIISISDMNDIPADILDKIPKEVVACLFLKFDDVDYDEENVMTREQADNIIEFVNAHINDVEEIIVQCGAGVSRSAGVCAALMLIINGDDTEIFSNHRYYPNRVCYRYILDAYYGNYENENLIEEKYRMNITAYRKAEGLDDTDS